MKRSRFLRIANHSGFSLLEVTVTAALLGLTALGMASIFGNMHHSQNGVNFRVNADTLNGQIRTLLSSASACQANFAGLSMESSSTGMAVTRLTDSSGNPQFQVGQAYLDNTLLLRSMSLDAFVPGSLPTQGRMTLRSNIFTDKIAAGTQVVQRDVILGLVLDPTTHKIINCVSINSMISGIWQQSQANVNNIYYSAPAPGGNVAVGTTPTTDALTVSGGLAATDTGVRFADGKIIAKAPPTCIGNSALQWDGTNWLCTLLP